MKSANDLIKFASFALVAGVVSAAIVLAVAEPNGILGAASGKRTKKTGKSVNQLLKNELISNSGDGSEMPPPLPITPPNINIPEPEVPELDRAYIEEIQNEIKPKGALLEPYNPGICGDHATSSSAWGKVRRVRYEQRNQNNPTICLIEIYPKGCNFLSTFVATYNINAEPDGYSYKFATRVCEAAERAITTGTPVQAFGTEDGFLHLHRLSRFHLMDFN